MRQGPAQDIDESAVGVSAAKSNTSAPKAVTVRLESGVPTSNPQGAQWGA